MPWSNGVQNDSPAPLCSGAAARGEPCMQHVGLSTSSPVHPHQRPQSDRSQRGAERGEGGHSSEQEGGEGHTHTHHQG